jgi:DinB family protein
MTHDLAETTALLARTPPALNALLRDLPEAWSHANEGAGTWSPFDIVAHLIHAERADWIPRVRIILESGEGRTFEPFERGGHVRESQGRSLPQLLDEFARVRSDNLDRLDAMKLRPEDLARRGQHPTLGAVTLSALLATWVVHDMTHLHQISRVLAHRYRETVGPWSSYLGVLQCAGHSASA